MALTIDYTTRIISVPQSDLTFVSGTTYELDIDAFRLELKDIEDGARGMPFVDTHTHNTEVTISGVTYARVVQIINGYRVDFEDTGSHYTVNCVGANHNLNDVTIFNGHVTLVPNNSAGLIVSGSGGGATAEEVWTYEINNKEAQNRLKDSETFALIAAAND